MQVLNAQSAITMLGGRRDTEGTQKGGRKWGYKYIANGKFSALMIDIVGGDEEKGKGKGEVCQVVFQVRVCSIRWAYGNEGLPTGSICHEASE